MRVISDSDKFPENGFSDSRARQGGCFSGRKRPSKERSRVEKHPRPREWPVQRALPWEPRCALKGQKGAGGGGDQST